ncbi:hypothetical protein CMUS01_13605 [Colletotrichum musicola]|uniref:Uncharacterized protein n=1 Tax=Colletotrichum musicola TaxID=2175873 RepID=A0A8H6MUU9_9PEZI|nr:hypothetical protein CMUS01_13605 [Colletotrichum musicola]
MLAVQDTLSLADAGPTAIFALVGRDERRNAAGNGRVHVWEQQQQRNAHPEALSQTRPASDGATETDGPVRSLRASLLRPACTGGRAWRNQLEVAENGGRTKEEEVEEEQK